MADFQKPFFAAFASTTLLTVGWWVAVLVLPCCRRCHPGVDSPVATALSAWSAAVCGALSQLFVKVVAVTLHEADGDFTSPASPWRTSGAPYLALSGLVFTAPMQLYLLDQAPPLIPVYAPRSLASLRWHLAHRSPLHTPWVTADYTS